MFHLKQNGTSVKTELLAGITTFLTMVYIVVVNPLLLQDAGIPFEQVFTATIIATVVGTLWMGLFANYPIAIAPGMGMNAYFAYSVVGSHGGITYETAFAAVFVSGLLFVLLSMTPLREKLIAAIPSNLKHGISAGIGLFIAFIGFRLTGIISADENNLVRLGDLHSPSALLALFGLAVTIILMVRGIKGALFIGMLITGLTAYLTGQLSFGSGFMSMPSMPEGLIVTNPVAAFGEVLQHSLYAVVFSFLLITIFDTTGTMIGVAQQAGLLKDNKLPRAKQALLADSVAATVGAMSGTSPTSAYIESSTGVAAGGRTGLTAVTVAALFLLAAFFGPLVSAVSGISAITAPALIIVGCLMMESVGKIDWHNLDEAFPAFLIILSMPLTSSIATGIALGFISYPLVKLARGRAKDVHPLVYVFALLFFYQLAFLPH